MKTQRPHLPPPCLAALLLFAGAASLCADYIPLADFASLPAGKSPDGTDGWVTGKEPDSTAVIADDPGGTPGHILELQGPPDMERYFLAAKTAFSTPPPPSASPGTLFFRFRLAGGPGLVELKIGVSHVSAEAAVAEGPNALKQLLWIRGGKAPKHPVLCHADGSMVEPEVSFRTDTWYDAWLVFGDGRDADATKFFIRSGDDPEFSELKEIPGRFVVIPVPAPLTTFVVATAGGRTVSFDRIACDPDMATPGETPP